MIPVVEIVAVKVLHLLRHAKSSWDRPQLPNYEHERPGNAALVAARVQV